MAPVAGNGAARLDRAEDRGVYVLSVAEMRAAERVALAAGIPEAELQARAGAAVAAWAQRLAPDGPVVVCAGVGNNGRDGWVAATRLAAAGRVVRLYLAPRHAVAEDEVAQLQALGGAVALHTGAESLERLGRWLGDATLALDGLLGIGARGAPRPPVSDIAACLNTARARRAGALTVLAIDVPSGIDAESGAAEGECVRADATVVLGAVKQGLLRFPAAGLTGVLLPGDIGLPPAALAGCRVQTLDAAAVRSDVPARRPDGHKGTFGRVVVAAGSPDYYGAAYLAGAAAARSGAGLVAYAVDPALQSVLAGLLPEATYVVLPPRAPAEAAEAAADRVVTALAGSQALLLGPGVGRTPGAQTFVRRVLAACAEPVAQVPVVIDADALYALALEPASLARLPAAAVLTPHHGEMARLTGVDAAAIATSPWEVASEAAARWRAVVVLKGPCTVVAAPTGEAWVLARPNPALATGGTGDVLAGTIAGLLAQGLSPLAAARLGVYVHAAAAQAVLDVREADLLLASDLLSAIPRELAALRRASGAWRPLAGVPWAERV
jgi:NAD(P)H-hydrate epimerase